MHKHIECSYLAKPVLSNHETVSTYSCLFFFYFFLLGLWHFIMINTYLDLNRFSLLKHKAFVGFSIILTKIPVY